MLTPDEVRARIAAGLYGDGFAEQLAEDYLRALRILAVERGDESQAPEGWTYSFTLDDEGWPDIGWTKGDAHVWRGPTVSTSEPSRWVWWWACGSSVGTEESTALEAMEAVDKAIASVSSEETPPTAT